MTTAPPRFSVVIPAYNEEYELPRTLAAFDRAVQRYREAGGAGEFEFIVTDNASTDRTAEIAAAWGVRVVHEPFRQIARARNAGVRAATGEIIITCDADSRPHPDIFNAIERRLTERVFAAGVRLDMPGLKWYYRPSWWAVNLTSLCGRLPAGMFIVRRNDFLKLGGFDERLFALEDVDFSRRLRAQARRGKKRIRILWNYPIRTSTRKFRRLPPAVIGRELWRFLWHPRKALRSREYWEVFYYGSGLRDGSPEERT